ncbi:hypothetical protein Dimus_003592, partial [Dionaea muscipula]
ILDAATVARQAQVFQALMETRLGIEEGGVEATKQHLEEKDEERVQIPDGTTRRIP